LAPVYQPVIVSPFPFVGFAQPVLAGAGGPAFQDAALGNPPLANNPPPAGLPLDEPAAGDFPAPRESNAAAKARAWQFVDQGDKKFAEQNFHSAYVAYRKAAAQAADLPEVYLRQGQAFVAMSQWEKAADRFRRGMALVEEAPRRLLPLDQLYGGHRVEQTAHLENAVLAGQGQPHHPDFLFLIGTQFYFDGQPERSLNFFQRASELSGGDDRHIRPFLDRIALLAARPNAGAAP
jgi:tetratricopeptide (TPR) repeat protein